MCAIRTLLSGRNSRVVFTGGSFCKGVRVPSGVPGRGFGVGFRRVVGGGFPVENEGKGEGGGEGEG